jgi:hypothetical protein
MDGDELPARRETRLTTVAKRVASIDDQLRFAIANRRLIEVTYRGGTRVVEPHDYGVHKGVTRLFVYQLSTTERKAGWRLLEVAGIEACLVLEKKFSARREPRQPRYAWETVYARGA